MDFKKRRGVSRIVMVGLGAVLIVALGGGIYFLGASSSAVTIDVQIIEDDPVNQVQHFYPGSFSATLGQNVSLAVRNGDDEPRTFVIKDFNVSLTMSAGTTGRVTFQASSVGSHYFYSPPSIPSPVSHGKPGMFISGNFTVSP